MNKRKGEIIWGALLLAWILLLVIPMSRDPFISFTGTHPYLGGFIKFSILAMMGDRLGYRILNNKWVIGRDFIPKAIVWGILGMMITLAFTLFSTGTQAAQAMGRLPFKGSLLGTAFLTSFTMNVTFGPMMYVYHKFMDLAVDFAMQHNRLSVNGMVAKIDWNSMVGFSWIINCLFVWVPVHTLVFLLPSEYRVLASAFLSILLGILIAVSKKGSKKEEARVR